MSSPIYGTHNSCTYGSLLNSCLCPVIPWVRDQSLTLSEQLERGIRWFDFRLSLEKGEIYLSHTYLMEHTLKSIMGEIADHLTRRPDSPFLMIHLRVDSNDLADQAAIEPLVGSILTSYASMCVNNDTFDAAIPLADNKTKGKILLYCANATLHHPLIFSSDLMPSLYGWDAGSIDAFEQRLLNMNAFCSSQTQPFLYPKERMIIFDYSSVAPLWWTDRQQRDLMTTHELFIRNQRPTIIAGNGVEEWMHLFQR